MSNLVTANATALLHTGPGRVGMVSLTGAGDAATVIIRDAVAGSGTDYVVRLMAAAAGVSVSRQLHGLTFSTGLHATITGTTPVVEVELL